MNFQMCKYYFKYMQNTLLTKDAAFMKGWDILNSYFYEPRENYMWTGIKKLLMSDQETLLYACFVLKEKLIKKLQREQPSRGDRSYADDVFDLIRQNMNRITSVHQVNNTPSLKSYNSMFDRSRARKMFKESYPHITILRDEEVEKKEDTRTREDRQDRSHSNSR